MLHRKNLWLAIVLLTAGFAAASARAQPVTKTNYASAQQVESAFRGHSFILGDDNQIADGIRSKVRIAKNSRKSGGNQFFRGALYALLSNPIYIGEIRHKGVHHPGLHES